METSTAVVDPPTNVSPRTVRTNWLLFSWSQISGATKVLLIITSILSLLQIATSVIVLVLGNQHQLVCDKPLELYLIIFVVRVGLSLPLSIYHHLFIPRRGRRRGANRFRNADDQSPTSEDTNMPENEQSRPSTIVSGWSERLKSLLDLFAILWFIVGNYLIFSSSNCSTRAGLYYYTIFAWVLFGYTILVIPLLACVSVIFCLPCVLVTMRRFNINVSNVMIGGTKEEILKIPVYKYKSNQEQQQQTQEVEGIKTTPHMKKTDYFSKFKKGHLKENVTTDKYLTIPKVEDAVCTICLSEYENDELICKLWCNHHYHHSCVTEWLSLNSKCPLCKRDFRKDHIDQDSDDEEQV